ncbi:tetratricopeptide repeat protein [Methanobacterium alcaliphilum]|uniref:tetratricopeptide repeat protein n=1 Tax=Methanobacterium alcaliphilum TaxID=392018 RepID=UPI00200A2325|nr:tetratricopeptide repeat protein [Methanobacterium alcaliphilum]MCK9152484.1 tetratricopeptide repeat protein [Methanobacterium alcaliphilum]
MILQTLGVFDAFKKKNEESLEYYIQRLEEIQNEEFDLLINISSIFLDEEKFEDSIKYLEKALRMAIDLNNNELEAFVLDSIGDVYLNSREIIKALEYYHESLRIYRSTKSPLKDEVKEKIKEVEKIKEALDISEINKMKGIAVPEVEEDYQMDIATIIPKLDLIVNMIDGVSMYESYSQDTNALVQLKEAFKISREIGDEPGEATLLLLMGNQSLKQEKLNEAFKYFKDAKEFFRRLNDEKGLAITMILLGTLNFIQGDIEGVSNNFRSAVEKFQKLDNKKAESLSIDILNTLYNE